jgi:hypothetical protein
VRLSLLHPRDVGSLRDEARPVVRWTIDTQRSTGAKAQPVAKLELNGEQLAELADLAATNGSSLAVDLAAANVELIRAS